MQPLVSIIIPIFNRAEIICDTLDSIYHQSYPNIELLVIDDGSTDNIFSVMDNWGKSHSSRFRSLHFFSQERNSGKAAVVNLGFSKCLGEYIMVFDSDDILISDAIEKEINFFLEHPTIDALCAGAFLMYGQEKTSTQFHPLKDQNSFEDLRQQYGDLLLKGNAVISSTVLMKRSIVEAIGGLNPELKIAHDWDYWIRITQRFRLGFMNVPVMYYRMNSDGSISQNKAKLFLEVCRVMVVYKKNYPFLIFLRAVIYQIKYHLWLAYKDKNIIQMILILYNGVIFLLGLFFQKISNV